MEIVILILMVFKKIIQNRLINTEKILVIGREEGFEGLGEKMKRLHGTNC